MARRGSTSSPGSPSARSSATCVPTSARAPTIASPRSRNSSPTRRRPGLTRQPRLVYTRTFVDFDYRDQPGNTRGGGRVLLQVGTGRDQDPSREFSYRRTDLEVLHVFPIFDKKRNFARPLRRRARRSAERGAAACRSSSRRPSAARTRCAAIATLRFRDATYVLFNAEYRWEAFSGLDLALFWDGGDVGTDARADSPRRAQDRLGLRPAVQYQQAVFMRIDVGFGGPEGTATVLRSSARRSEDARHGHRPDPSPLRSSRRLLVLGGLGTGAGAGQPVYFPDDPIALDPETQDACKVRELGRSAIRTTSSRTRSSSPAIATPRRARERQHHRRSARLELVHQPRRPSGRSTADEVRRGPDTTSGPAAGPWTIVSGKSDGVTPGFTIRDTAGDHLVHQVRSASRIPEMATGAEMVVHQALLRARLPRAREPPRRCSGATSW